jgi:hypothetical protein
MNARLPANPTRYSPEEGEILQGSSNWEPSDEHSIVGYGEGNNGSTHSGARTLKSTGALGKGKG